MKQESPFGFESTLRYIINFQIIPLRIGLSFYVVNLELSGSNICVLILYFFHFKTLLKVIMISFEIYIKFKFNI